MRGKFRPGIDKKTETAQTRLQMQLSGNSTLLDLRRGDAAILDSINLPEDDAQRLMELGFLPGSRVTAARSAPGGDPCVFQVDGAEIALRRETARLVKVRFS